MPALLQPAVVPSFPLHACHRPFVPRRERSSSTSSSPVHIRPTIALLSTPSPSPLLRARGSAALFLKVVMTSASPLVNPSPSTKPSAFLVSRPSISKFQEFCRGLLVCDALMTQRSDSPRDEILPQQHPFWPQREECLIPVGGSPVGSMVDRYKRGTILIMLNIQTHRTKFDSVGILARSCHG
ncbi:hypothetical protein OG21DRAFT_1135065 [Imleria badia]|nr:hypothetical protein OG21DRAFT_1135065 [Imleria badia]